MSKRAFGNIRKRETKTGVSYIASYEIPGTNRKRRSKTFRAKTQAAKWLKETEHALLTGQNPAPAPSHPTDKSLTVKELADQWVAHLEARNVSPNTMRSYLSVLRCHILPQLAALPLRDLDAKRCRIWWEGLETVKPGARQNAYRVLSALLNYAVDLELIGACPLKIKNALKREYDPDRDVKRERVASCGQVEQIARLMPARLRICVYLAAYGGLRYSEIAALRRKHIDLEAGLLRVRAGVKRKPNGGLVEGPPKSALSVRDIPLSPLLSDRLRQHLCEHVGVGADSLVVHSSSGADRFLSNKSLHHVFDPAVAMVGLEGFWFHQLRATCATRLMRLGATPVEVQKILGHSNWATSILYQRAPTERLKQLMGSL